MHGTLEVAVSGIAAKLVKVSAVLYNLSFVQQVHAAGETGALAFENHAQGQVAFPSQGIVHLAIAQGECNSCGLY